MDEAQIRALIREELATLLQREILPQVRAIQARVETTVDKRIATRVTIDADEHAQRIATKLEQKAADTVDAQLLEATARRAESAARAEDARARLEAATARLAALAARTTSTTAPAVPA